MCDDNFLVGNTRVACRQLGLGDGVMKLNSGLWGNGILIVFILILSHHQPLIIILINCIIIIASKDTFWDEMFCNGYETRLDECSRNPWGVHDCTYYENIYIVCNLPGIYFLSLSSLLSLFIFVSCLLTSI